MKTGILAAGLACCVHGGSALADVEATDVWVAASVNAMRTTSAYMTLLSRTGAALVAAKSPVVRSIEIEETRHEKGLSYGWPAARIIVPAGQTVVLKPGGLHLLLVDTDSLLAEGDRIPLTLTFEQGGQLRQLTVEGVVRTPEATR